MPDHECNVAERSGREKKGLTDEIFFTGFVKKAFWYILFEIIFVI